MFDPESQPLRGAYSIEASAGTGKTFSITLLWLRLLIEEELKVEQILVSTFTKAATAELKERLLASLRKAHTAATQWVAGMEPGDCPETRILRVHQAKSGERLDALTARIAMALSSFDLAPVSTLHSFCQGLISRHAMELGADPGQTLVQDTSAHFLPLLHDELLQLSDQDAPLNVAALSRSTQAAVLNPDATLLGWDAESTRLFEETKTRLVTGLRTALENPGKTATKTKLQKDLEQIQNGCPPEKLSDAQATFVGSEVRELWMHFTELCKAKAGQAALQVARNVRTRFDAARQSAGIRSFDDLVRAVRDALETTQGADGKLARAVRARLRAAIIDECQDSDFAQIHVLKTLFCHAETVSLLVIGDPKQSIYRFRGADLASYRNLTAITQRAPVMTTNHRSDGSLVEAINRLYAPAFTFPDQNLATNPVQYVPVQAAAGANRIQDPDRKSLVVQWVADTARHRATRHLAEEAAAECHRLLHAHVRISDRQSGEPRRLVPSDIAFLGSTARELRILRAHLHALGIPSELSGRGLGSVFESMEAQDIWIWLDTLQSLQTRGDLLPKLLAFAATPLSGIPPQRLAALQTEPSFQADVCALLRADLECVERSGPLPALVKRLDATGVQETHLPFADGERRITNWRQIGTLLQQQHHAGARGVGSLAVWLGRAIAADHGAGSDETQMRLETDSPAVQLLTIHGSKGLEFPVVFCPFLWSVRQRNLRETRCHAALVRTDSEWILDTGSQRFAEHRTLALRQEDEEEHRKLYVALTRPRHRLYLGIAPVAATQNSRNGADSSPLAKLPGLGLEHRPLQEWESALDALPFLQVLSAPAAFQNAQRVPAEHAGSSAVPGVPYDPEASVGVPSRSGEQPGLIQLRFGGVPHRVSSFSALSRTSHDTPSAKEHNPGIEEDDVSAGADLLEPLNLSGTELGTWIHGVLEDYLGNRKSAVESVGTVGQPALPLLQTILSTPIPLPDGHTVTLESVRDSCVTEMQFHLPVGQLDPKKLSAALLADPAVSGNADRRFWAEELATLGFHEFTGFLQGFIDLIFEHEGRWYVLDYKSNRLEGYNPARLEQAMLDSKYLLQARIYAFALHQHLSVHLPLYDPTKHLGGVLYLFLRGMPKAGFWSETPSAAALQSFATLFSKN